MAVQQGINPYLNQDQWNKMYNLKRGLAVAQMPLDSAIGFGIGSLIKNYLSRGNEKKAYSSANNNTITEELSDTVLPEPHKLGDDLSNNNEYIRQAVIANSTIPQGTTMDEYNQIRDDNRIINGYQNINNNNTNAGILGDLSGLKVNSTPTEINNTVEKSTPNLLGAATALKTISDPNVDMPSIAVQPSSDVQNIQQQQIAANTQLNELEKQRDRNLINLAIKAYSGGLSFDNAATSNNSEVAANSYPEYLRGKIEGYVNLINSAKKDYMIAQANNDIDSMNKASLQASGARTELIKLGVDPSAFGSDKTEEQSEKALDSINFYKLPEAQKITPFQQQVADKITGDLIAAKYAYDSAATDGERMLAQVQARNARNLAKQYGLDVSAYGSDVTADRAAMAGLYENPQFNAETANSRYGANPISTQAYWQQMYEQAMSKGVGREAAERYATQQAGVYQAEKMNDLSAQLVQFGVNPDGSVSDLGMSILAQMRNEDPDAYTQLLSAYGMPKDIFTFNNQIKRDNNTAANQINAMVTQGNINSEIQSQRAQQQAQLQAQQAQEQAALYQLKAQIDRQYKNASLVDKLNIMQAYLMQQGVDSQTAGLMAAGVYKPEGKSSGGGSNGKEPTYITEVNNLVDQMLRNVDHYATADVNAEEAEKLRASTGSDIDAVADYLDKHKEKFDTEDITRIRQAMYAANYKRAEAAYRRTGNMEYKKQAEAYKQYVPEEILGG